MIKKIKIIIFLLTILFPSISYALIEVDITRGNLNPLPVAVSPLFYDENSKSLDKKKLDIKNIGSEISSIIEFTTPNTDAFHFLAAPPNANG